MERQVLNVINTKYRTLLLSKTWEPVSVIKVDKCLGYLYNNMALVIDPKSYRMFNFSDWIKFVNTEIIETEGKLISAKLIVPIPEIIVYKKKIKPYYNRNLRFSKKLVYERDNNTCGYCGKQISGNERTIDHVQPTSKGGSHDFNNVVTCCLSCNRKKANKTIEELNWKLNHRLTNPSSDLFYHIPKKFIKQSWRIFANGKVN
jgi:5-methylcytosine-specific restriction endonuclease McrA